MSDPKVFAPGCLTVAGDRETIALSFGHLPVGFIKSFNLAYDGESRAVKAVIEFYQSHHEPTARQIEESVRIAKSLGWVEVKG